MHRLRNGCTQRVLILLTWNISRRNTLISAQRNWAESWPRHQPEKLQESMVPWSCDILRHPATSCDSISKHHHCFTTTNAHKRNKNWPPWSHLSAFRICSIAAIHKTQKLRFEYWESPDCTSSCPTIFIDQRMLVHPQLSSWVADYLNAFAPDERMMNVNNRLKRISRGRIPDLCPVTACRGHEARTGNLLFSWLAKWEVCKVITDVRGTSAHEQIRRGEVAGTLWKVNFEARANGLGVIKSWKYRFYF